MSLMLQEMGHAVGLRGKVHKHYADRAFLDRLVSTMKVGDADPAAYDAIYMTGGHGVCFDFPRSAALAQVIARLFETRKVVSAVCHGPTGLLEVKVGGDYLVRGKKLTGFSWAEEGLAKREDAVPYDLEEKLEKRGANYDKSSVPFKSYVVEDGLLITGQNPASAAEVGEVVVKKLKAGAGDGRHACNPIPQPITEARGGLPRASSLRLTPRRGPQSSSACCPGSSAG